MQRLASLLSILAVFSYCGTLEGKDDPVDRVSEIEQLRQARDFACCPLAEARYVFDFNESSEDHAFLVRRILGTRECCRTVHRTGETRQFRGRLRNRDPRAPALFSHASRVS